MAMGTAVRMERLQSQSTQTAIAAAAIHNQQEPVAQHAAWLATHQAGLWRRSCASGICLLPACALPTTCIFGIQQRLLVAIGIATA
jgi:hypothetical protein